jgi:hypothetical protein
MPNTAKLYEITADGPHEYEGHVFYLPVHQLEYARFSESDNQLILATPNLTVTIEFDAGQSRHGIFVLLQSAFSQPDDDPMIVKAKCDGVKTVEVALKILVSAPGT